MTEARRLFEELQREGAGGPELLADIGFTEAGIRAIGGLRIEGDSERLQSLKEALERGREWFERAVSVGGDSAVNAHFALAVLEYLGWMSAPRDEGSRDELRKKALDHARIALAGMIGSGRSEAYDRAGVAGQCRFVLAAARLGSLEAREVRAAVLEILGIGEWVASSTVVREALRELAQDESRPRRVRFEIWEKLVPIAIRAGRVAVAEEGLDTMEGLAAKDSELAERFTAWLEDGRKGTRLRPSGRGPRRSIGWGVTWRRIRSLHGSSSRCAKTVRRRRWPCARCCARRGRTKSSWPHSCCPRWGTGRVATKARNETWRSASQRESASGSCSWAATRPRRATTIGSPKSLGRRGRACPYSSSIRGGVPT